ncbi:MAG: ATP-binding protein [Candidatus Omnitrophica bacterium]|nr:ATP-binding protein [Candidatus Omnitrophota bacterium]MCG2707427.1 ATP-binding protein [Candidatus Omnitrophota bacterium]
MDLDKNNLSIIDDGNGMDEKDLVKYVIYGESDKTSTYKSPEFKRSPIGEYGMGGKLAISNLCKFAKFVTKRDGKEHIFNMDKDKLDKAKYITDIQRVVITKKCHKDLHGTSIYMSNLLYRRIDYGRFLEKLSEKMPISQNFKIYVTVIKDNEEKKYVVEEPKFDAEKEFYYEDNLKLIGAVNLKVYYTKEAIPATKQGVWTKVNGRIVNEKQEWFGLLNLTSGQRYRWRLYGIGNADGLKDYVTFSKNDFIDCDEYREYYDFIHNCLKDIQNQLLKADDDLKKEKQRQTVKNIEDEVNKVVTELDKPEVMKEITKTILKDTPRKIEEKAEEEGKDVDVEEIVGTLKDVVQKGKQRREKRKNNLKKEDKVAYEGKSYIIETVDMSSGGDLIRFTSEKNLIEINEKHPFYTKAGHEDYLDNLIRDLAYMEIARDYSEGNDLIFDNVFNKLAKLSLKYT